MKKVEYLASAMDHFPLFKLPSGKTAPEIAIAGRSNVGKSSFINALLQDPSLARTSSTPGKTRRIHFFLCEESFVLADLPGYGYARAPKSEIEEWSASIDAYLNEREQLKLVLLLADCRRGFAAEEFRLIEWAKHKNIPIVSFFTKSDKLSRSEIAELMKHTEKDKTFAAVFAISNRALYERNIILKKIQELL